MFSYNSQERALSMSGEPPTSLTIRRRLPSILSIRVFVFSPPMVMLVSTMPVTPATLFTKRIMNTDVHSSMAW